MPRSFTYSALTLRVKSTGESNREAWFLTAEEGILRATLFGGPKSRLRALVTPFHGGKLWIYHDPVRDSRKVNDFDVQSYRSGIRELWERTMTANAVAETVLSSHGGGGNWKTAIDLAGNVLDVLDKADANTCSRTGIYFLWRWAEILGVKPDLSSCVLCGREAEREENLWFSTGREFLYCEDCMRNNSSQDMPAWFRAGPGARLWLGKIESLPAADMARFTLDTVSFDQAGKLSKAILTAALGKSLPTWQEF